jgi:hypothetical protein
LLMVKADSASLVLSINRADWKPIGTTCTADLHGSGRTSRDCVTGSVSGTPWNMLLIISQTPKRIRTLQRKLTKRLSPSDALGKLLPVRLIRHSSVQHPRTNQGSVQHPSIRQPSIRRPSIRQPSQSDSPQPKLPQVRDASIRYLHSTKVCLLAAVQYSAVPHDSTTLQVKRDGLNARASSSIVHRSPPCQELCRKPSKMQKHLKTRRA